MFRGNSVLTNPLETNQFSSRTVPAREEKNSKVIGHTWGYIEVTTLAKARGPDFEPHSPAFTTHFCKLLMQAGLPSETVETNKSMIIQQMKMNS